MIPVTKSFIPPIEEYTVQVQRAFDNGWLTNRGELVKELESNLQNYLELGESKILCTNNGTTPLQIALKLLGKGGEVITTPFSYVATTASIVWENCTPVFVDIDPEHLTIDETRIEEAITDKTTCILATHVFGNPCNVEEIDRIAKKHNLKVIYDAAHCFGVKYNGRSIFEFGDISTCSFHATKLFHTGEGGALFTRDPHLYRQAYLAHNFGHTSSLDIDGVGINCKMSELNAAMGLALLPYMDHIRSSRDKLVRNYFELCKELKIGVLKIREHTLWNSSYFPVIFNNESELLKVQENLKKNGIIPRRYFYPSLDRLNYTKKSKVECAHGISERILCLPNFVGLDFKEQADIMNLISCCL